jgi:hypothetical protein
VNKALLEENGISTLEKGRVVLLEMKREEEGVCVNHLKVLSYSH